MYLAAGSQTLPIHVVVGVVRAQAAARGMLVRQGIRRNYFSQKTSMVCAPVYDDSDASTGDCLSGGDLDSPRVILPILE